MHIMHHQVLPGLIIRLAQMFAKRIRVRVNERVFNLVICRYFLKDSWQLVANCDQFRSTCKDDVANCDIIAKETQRVPF